MFKKITATAAALLLALVVTSAATIQSADASGTVTGDLCVIATNREDPTIIAKHGNCAAEPAPEATPTEQVIHHYISRIRFVEVNPDGGPVRATVVNQVTGKTVFDETQTFTWDGAREFEIYDHFVHPASDPVPTYLLTLTFGGRTYTHVSEASVFYDSGMWDGLQSYVAEDYMHFQNGAIGAGIGG